MDNSKLYHHDINAEKAIVAWMQSEGQYIEIPEDYLYNSEIRSIYSNWRKQYLQDGAFQWSAIPEGLEVVLSECMEIATTSSPKPIITKLRTAYMVRKSCELSINIHTGLEREKDPTEVLDKASGLITELLTEQYSMEYNHTESLSNFLVELNENRIGKNKFKGVPSHLPDLDWLLSGWERGKVYLVSGLEKLGKSRLVRNLFSTWLAKNYGCIMFLLEEDENAVHECIIASRTRIDTFLFNTSNMTEDQYGQVSYETNIYKEQPLYIDIKSAITPQYIKSMIQKKKIEFAKRGVELTFVAIDYIQRMSNSGDSKHEQTENTAGQLANIARDENVCLIEISQLTSGAEKLKNTPLHTQIRFGKVFKEAASCIITLDDPTRNKEEDEQPNDFKTISAHIIQRKGKSNITVDLCAELQYSSFTNFQKGV